MARSRSLAVAGINVSVSPHPRGQYRQLLLAALGLVRPIHIQGDQYLLLQEIDTSHSSRIQGMIARFTRIDPNARWFNVKDLTMTFANSSRRLRVSGTNFEYLSEGALNLIFVDRMQKKVWKVARADRDIPRSHLEKVFQSEVKAYELATNSAELREVVPRFFGVERVPGIVDGSGRDVSIEVHADLAFQIEYIDGEFQKISMHRDYIKLAEAFRSVGIHYTIDASACFSGDRVSKVIDFATEEFELLHE